MRVIKYAVVILFVFMIAVPVVTMNMTPDSISKIDNRALAKFPFGEDAPNGDLTKNIENYVQDRIGFRDKMILAFTMLNDRLFGKMVHPTYCYGKGSVKITVPPSHPSGLETTIPGLPIAFWGVAPIPP